jgi:hypothetical protein
MGKDVFFNEICHMISCSGSDVSQTPSSLKLELRDMMMKETHQNWHKVGVNDSLDWRLVFNRKELSKTDTSQELLVKVLRINELAQSAEVRNLIKKW